MMKDSLRTLPDAELAEVIEYAQSELKARAEKRKQDTIARIKELAGSVGVVVTIAGQRGRPAKNPSASRPSTHRPKETKPASPSSGSEGGTAEK